MIESLVTLDDLDKRDEYKRIYLTIIEKKKGNYNYIITNKNYHVFFENNIAKILQQFPFKLVSFMRISDISISKFPEEMMISNVNLREIDLSYNPIETLPDKIGEWKHLKKFFARGCKLHFLPETVCNWTSIKEVNLSLNSLTFLPDGVRGWIDVRVVNLQANNLYALNEGCVYWKKVKIVNLSLNLFEELSGNIIQEWKNITDLDITYNRLIRLPNEMCVVPFSAYINTFGNPRLACYHLGIRIFVLCEMCKEAAAEVLFLYRLAKKQNHLFSIVSKDIVLKISKLVEKSWDEDFWLKNWYKEDDKYRDDLLKYVKYLNKKNEALSCERNK